MTRLEWAVMAAVIAGICLAAAWDTIDGRRAARDAAKVRRAERQRWTAEAFLWAGLAPDEIEPRNGMAS